MRKKANPKQRKLRRSDFDYPYLEPSVALLKRKEEVEDVASYIHNCPPEAKEWMNQYMKEYNDADLTDAKFHISKEDRKKCFDKNNARNRCWYTEEAAANRLNLIENEYEMERLMYGSDVLSEDDTTIEEFDSEAGLE